MTCRVAECTNVAEYICTNNVAINDERGSVVTCLIRWALGDASNFSIFQAPIGISIICVRRPVFINYLVAMPTGII